MRQIKSWNEWLSHCKTVWNESPDNYYTEAKTVLYYLKNTQKFTTDNLISIAARAWKDYKSDNL